MDPSATPIAEVAPVTPRPTTVLAASNPWSGAGGPWPRPVRPVMLPWLGNASGSVLPMVLLAREVVPHCTPSVRANSRVVWTMRASISTCGCGESSVAMSDRAFCSRSGRSLMMMVFVRVSVWIVPRCESTVVASSFPMSSAFA